MNTFVAIVLLSGAIALAVALPFIPFMFRRLSPGDIRVFIVPLAVGLGIFAAGAVTAWIVDPPVSSSLHTCEQ